MDKKHEEEKAFVEFRYELRPVIFYRTELFYFNGSSGIASGIPRMVSDRGFQKVRIIDKENIDKQVQDIIKDERPVFMDFFTGGLRRGRKFTEDNVEMYRNWLKETRWRLHFGIMRPDGVAVYDRKPEFWEIMLGDLCDLNRFYPGERYTPARCCDIVMEMLVKSDFIKVFAEEIRKQIG